MNSEDIEFCRKFARQICETKESISIFKNNFEDAAREKNRQMGEPEKKKYIYAHSYDDCLRFLLSFEAQLDPQTMSPSISPNGKMTETSEKNKSAVISDIKGQIRHDRGTAVKFERVAGLYAWINSSFGEIAQKLHKELQGANAGDEGYRAIYAPRNLARDIETNTPSGNLSAPKWQALLHHQKSRPTLNVRPVVPRKTQLVSLSQSSRSKLIKLELGEDFYFDFECPFEGYALGLQGYKDAHFKLPLTNAPTVVPVRNGNTQLPAHIETLELLPLSEQSDSGLHRFVIIVFANVPPRFDLTPFVKDGMISPTHLEALADTLMGYPERNWSLLTTQVMFQ